MIEAQVITCPHCKKEALAGSHRLGLDGQLGCIHCSQGFDRNAAEVRTITFKGETGTVYWGGGTQERRRNGRVPRLDALEKLKTAS